MSLPGVRGNGLITVELSITKDLRWEQVWGYFFAPLSSLMPKARIRQEVLDHTRHVGSPQGRLVCLANMSRAVV